MNKPKIPKELLAFMIFNSIFVITAVLYFELEHFTPTMSFQESLGLFIIFVLIAVATGPAIIIFCFYNLLLIPIHKQNRNYAAIIYSIYVSISLVFGAIYLYIANNVYRELNNNPALYQIGVLLYLSINIAGTIHAMIAAKESGLREGHSRKSHA